jgi:drug/metabolite transporter (DMT)-like permease
MMYGTYADILFVLFPFLVISMQRLWDGELYETLMRADLSVAAAILAGLAMGKFVLGLVTNRDLGRYKERIVFFIALTLFVVLGPAIILMLSITSSSELPGFIAFVQPVLLIIAISLYTTAVSISNILTRSDETVMSISSADQAYDEAEPAASVTPQNEPLAIPRRDQH